MGAPQNRRLVLSLLVLFAAAFVLRGVYILGAKRHDPPYGDAIYYSAQAKVIAHGDWYTDPFRVGRQAADHPPLTALVTAPAEWVAPDSLIAQRFVMAILGSAAVVMIALVGRRLVSNRVGAIAGTIALVHPGLWINDGLIMSESITALTVSGTLLAAVSYGGAPSRRAAVVFGAAIGLTICARAEIALCVPLLAWPMIARARVDGIPMIRRERLTHAVIVTGLAAAVLAPWTIYNLSRFDRPVLISTNDGLTLAGANCDQTYSGPGIGFWSLQCGVDAIASAERAAQAKPDQVQPDQSVISAHQRSIATHYISDHLGELPKVMSARVLRVWSLWDPRQMVYLNTGEGRETWASWMATYAFWGLAATSVVGARLARRRSITIAPLISLTVIVTIVAMVFYGITRFRLPAEIAMIDYAAIALDTVTARTNRGPTSSVAATTIPT